ncbi:MAG: dihydrofolate reductase family protein [Bacteroidales bacterium]
MKKVILYIASSLDGMIATRQGGVDWLNTSNELFDENPNIFGYVDFYKSIGTTIMGHNTYEEILSFNIPFPYPDKINYVFTRSERENDDNPVEFITENPAKFVSELKNDSFGGDIWLIGGSQINKYLLNANLIDEIILSIHPVVIGSGIPLFAEGTLKKDFEIIETVNFENIFIQIHFRRKKCI